MPPSRSQKQPAVAPQSRPRTRRQVAAAQLAVQGSPDAVDKPAENQGQADDLQTPKMEVDKAPSGPITEDWSGGRVEQSMFRLKERLDELFTVAEHRLHRGFAQILNGNSAVPGRYGPLPNDLGLFHPQGYTYDPDGGMTQQRIMHMLNDEVEAWLTHFGKPGAKSADETTQSKRERLVVVFTSPRR